MLFFFVFFVRFFDTAEEEHVTREMQQEFRPVTVEELEGKRRKDIEDSLIKRDIKRQKLQVGRSGTGRQARRGEAGTEKREEAAARQEREGTERPAGVG